MPAVIRGAPKGQGRAPAKGGGGGPRRGPAKAVYAPSKLKGAGAVGLDHRAALWAALGLLCLVLLLTVFTGGRLQMLGGSIASAIDRQFAGFGFKVKSVTVQGGSPFSTPYVLQAAGLTQGQPILGLNLDAVREHVEQVGWIKSAKVIRLLPDSLVIAVTERPRLAVWQHGDQTSVVDKDGQIIPEADAGLFSDLPLIVGEGANEAVAAMLPEITARPSLMGRLEALVRVDGRRWDLRLKDGGIVQLPATREDSALIQFDQLEQKSRLLETGFDRVDLRDSEMITVRPKSAPATVPAPTAQVAAAPAATTEPAKAGM
jgi:cell division protein FtsQ